MPRAEYHEIAAEIRREIEEGELLQGSSVPSEAQLTDKFGVSRPTIRKALAELQDAGLIEVIPGRGRFVKVPEGAAAPVRTDKKYEQVVDDLRRLLASGEVSTGDRLGTSAELAERFGVSVGTAKRALGILQDEGTITPVQGQAWFVGNLGIDADRTAALARQLRDAIQDGRFPPGSSLPGELALAAQFEVGRITVRRALAILESEGLIEIRAGRRRHVLGALGRNG